MGKNVQKPSHDLFLLLQFLPALLFSAVMWLLSVPAVWSPFPPSLVLGLVFFSSDSPHATKASWTPQSSYQAQPLHPSGPVSCLQHPFPCSSSPSLWPCHCLALCLPFSKVCWKVLECSGQVTGVLISFSAVWLLKSCLHSPRWALLFVYTAAPCSSGMASLGQSCWHHLCPP